jgi:hypothetical protein
MVLPTNGWGAVRPNWKGTLGMDWRVPPPRIQGVFRPETWKPQVPGRTYPMASVTATRAKAPRKPGGAP